MWALRLHVVLGATLSLALGCFWAVPAAAEDIQGLPDPKAPCIGQLEKRHSPTPYDFTTNSQRPTDGFTFQHCVHNNRSSVVSVRWLIPGLNATIAGNETRLSPRYSDKPPLGNKDGCLIYGNLLDQDLKADFWARSDDAEALEREKSANCMAVFKTPPPAPRKAADERASLKDILAPFRFFLSADPKMPEATLMAFEGVVGVKVTSGKSYEIFLRYRVRPTEGSKGGELAGFTIAPVWRGSAEVLAKFFTSKGNEARMKIASSDKQTEISFSVEGSDAWSFSELDYQIRDMTNTIVGVLHAPAFIPAR